jgi:hypothetical protein
METISNEMIDSKKVRFNRMITGERIAIIGAFVFTFYFDPDENRAEIEKAYILDPQNIYCQINDNLFFANGPKLLDIQYAEKLIALAVKDQALEDSWENTGDIAA